MTHSDECCHSGTCRRSMWSYCFVHAHQKPAYRASLDQWYYKKPASETETKIWNKVASILFDSLWKLVIFDSHLFSWLRMRIFCAISCENLKTKCLFISLPIGFSIWSYGGYRQSSAPDNKYNVTYTNDFGHTTHTTPFKYCRADICAVVLLFVSRPTDDTVALHNRSDATAICRALQFGRHLSYTNRHHQQQHRFSLIAFRLNWFIYHRTVHVIRSLECSAFDSCDFKSKKSFTYTIEKERRAHILFTWKTIFQ